MTRDMIWRRRRGRSVGGVSACVYSVCVMCVCVSIAPGLLRQCVDWRPFATTTPPPLPPPPPLLATSSYALLTRRKHPTFFKKPTAFSV